MLWFTSAKLNNLIEKTKFLNEFYNLLRFVDSLLNPTCFVFHSIVFP